MAEDVVSVLLMPSPSPVSSFSTTSKWRVLDSRQIHIDLGFDFADDCAPVFQVMSI